MFKSLNQQVLKCQIPTIYMFLIASKLIVKFYEPIVFTFVEELCYYQFQRHKIYNFLR